MPYVLQIDFPFSGPFGEQMSEAMRPWAEDIAREPGLLWKIWTENQASAEAGGIYLFASEEQAQQYLDKHSKRLAEAGVSGLRSRIFTVNRPLSLLDGAPLA